MNKLSNQQALSLLRQHKNFLDFLNSIEFENYPGLDLNKIFYFISTGVMIENMPIDSTRKLVDDIKMWLVLHSHGGYRPNSGAKQKHKNIVRINLSAEESDIANARKIAERKNTSLQFMFRAWLHQLYRTQK